MKTIIAAITIFLASLTPAMAQERFDLTVTTPIAGQPRVNTAGVGLSYNLFRVGNVHVNALGLVRNFGAGQQNFTGGVQATLPVDGRFNVGIGEVLHNANAVRLNSLNTTKLDTVLTLGVRI